MSMRRGGHTGKSKGEKEVYAQILKHSESEPTVDETLLFPHSDKKEITNPEKEIATFVNEPRRRPKRTIESLKEHLSDNWFFWLCSLIATIVGIFFFHFNRDMGKMEGKMEGVDVELKNQRDSIKELDDHIGARLQNQQKDIDETKSRVQRLEIETESRRR